MDLLKKPATSTPNSYTKPTSRRGIRDDDCISPIPRMLGRTSSNTSLSHLNTSDNEDESFKELCVVLDKLLTFKSTKEETLFLQYFKYKSRNELVKQLAENIENEDCITESKIRQYIKNLKDEAQSANSNKSIYWAAPMVIVIVVAVVGWFYTTEVPIKESYDNYSYTKFVEEFPTQHEDLWYSIESGIADAKSLNRPSTFIFLYTNEQENQVLEKILKKLGGYAACSLRNCEEPLIIEGQSLNEFPDHGQIITQNREKLEETGVMIVKNLEQINQNAALAFHHICDQYQPLVAQSIIVFTMKVDKYVPPVLNTQHCEQILRRLWEKMPDDKFYPLYTRLSNVIYSVMP